jgi:hypothetical protein
MLVGMYRNKGPRLVVSGCGKVWTEVRGKVAGERGGASGGGVIAYLGDDITS